MKTSKSNNRNRNLVLKVILGFIIGISFGFGVAKLIKSESRLTSSIEKSIRKNCDCESVRSEFSAVGLQFSKEDGINNRALEITLENCTVNTKIEKEAARLHEVLKMEVDNYADVDLLILHFQNTNKSETVKIKQGEIIQNKI
ncbi:hypothetical protein [Gillisia sp. Hel_I_29]|uniref:hypothetical protein n=1 Tax=Gillisia sp. Hel_I_29 TaxID=1249975 RepID=UPI00054D4C1E|nr:hypothetical protein [Gillisia sp. Hel_I_29]